ncbi:MAG: hypothetical protein ACRD12_00560 [Acidimicrobiales bacterium]
MSIECSGTVTRRLVAPGSKSEREAVVLDTGADQYVLRRIGGNPFSDPQLEELVGRNVRAIGEVHGPDFIMSEWTVAD